jgi:hypothetical protein
VAGRTAAMAGVAPTLLMSYGLRRRGRSLASTSRDLVGEGGKVGGRPERRRESGFAGGLAAKLQGSCFST